MPFYPIEVHLVRLFRFQKTLPQVGILDRLILPTLPALFDPSLNPVLIECIDHILGIRIKLYLARSVERFQPPDDSHQLHPVIGCPHIAAGKLFNVKFSLRVYIFQNDSISWALGVMVAHLTDTPYFLLARAASMVT